VSKRLGLVLSATAASVALVVGLGSVASQGAPDAVSIYPVQGTPTASPTTQISFRGATSADLNGVTVTGSTTGQHHGTLRAHSDGAGASFVPDHPFSPGETVAVTAPRPLVGAASGIVTFRILRPPLKHGKPQLLPDPGGSPRVPRYHSRPDLRPPTLGVLKKTAGAYPGGIFAGVKAGPGADGAVIYDSNGGLVWFKPSPHHKSVFDFRVQRYDGRPVLTWWEGTAIFPGEGLGVGVIYDISYRPVAIVHAGNGYVADLHEFQITPQNTALIMAYRPVQWDLSPAHGSPRGIALDNVLQEIDVKTGLVEREWHSLGHVNVGDAAVKPVPNIPFDAFHANSIEQEADGNWLVSSRNSNALYEVDRSTGQILWRIGGKRSSFKMGRGAQTLGQHDARRAPDGNITVFDNGTFGIKVGRPSRALELSVDQQGKTVSVVHSFGHRNPTERTFSQGSVRTLSNGNLLVGWGGANAYITEFSKSGQVVFDGLFHPTGDDTYRVFKFPWSGIVPAEPPRAAAAISRGATSVWASWNGATDVATWRVFGGGAAGSLAQLAETRRTGFETGIRVRGSQKFVQVQALDASGKVLGTSAVTQAH